MLLFERVKQVANQFAGSETKLAGILGLRQRQLNGYLNDVSQRNLWEHLPAILTAFPQVRRDWLYFGEGEMLKTDTPPAPVPMNAPPVPDQSDEIARLRAELDEERRLNRKLVTRLLIDGAGDKAGSASTVGKTTDGQR